MDGKFDEDDDEEKGQFQFESVDFSLCNLMPNGYIRLLDGGYQVFKAAGFEDVDNEFGKSWIKFVQNNDDFVTNDLNIIKFIDRDDESYVTFATFLVILQKMEHNYLNHWFIDPNNMRRMLDVMFRINSEKSIIYDEVDECDSTKDSQKEELSNNNNNNIVDVSVCNDFDNDILNNTNVRNIRLKSKLQRDYLKLIYKSKSDILNSKTSRIVSKHELEGMKYTDGILNILDKTKSSQPMMYPQLCKTVISRNDYLLRKHTNKKHKCLIM